MPGGPENESEGDRSTTNLAYDRTLLSWVRTGTSLITFGFAVYNFRRVIRGAGEESFEFAFVLIAIGLVTLLLAALEYRRAVRTLAAQCFEMPRSRLPIAVALLVAVLGILVLLSMLMRHY